MTSTDTGPASAGDSEFIATAAVARWEVIVDTLTPVLGQRGVSALYRRCLTMAGRLHPCLLEAYEDTELPAFKKLRKALLRQPPEVSAAATDASLETFHELLNSLVGSSLTQRLLGAAWSPTFSGSPAQDKST